MLKKAKLREAAAHGVSKWYSFLCQMLCYFRENPPGTQATSWSLIDELVEKKTNGIHIGDQELPSFVARTAREFLRRPLIIIDGLDGCKDIERLLDALVTWDMSDKMRIFVTSRPLQIIKEKLLHGRPKLVISWQNFQKEVSPDILKFIERKLNACHLSEARVESIKNDLLQEAEGMFVWAKYQIDMLIQCSEIRQLTRNPSPAVIDLYDRIMLGINEQKIEPKLVRRALAWLVSALQPIRLCEVVEALTIDVDRETMRPEWLRECIHGPVSTAIHSHQTLELDVGNVLLHALGSLVTHDEARGYITFIHSSVKTYLAGLSTNTEYRIDLEDAHEELAATCMCYVSLCLRGTLTSINNEPPFRITLGNKQPRLIHQKGSPLIEYVLAKTFHHLPLLHARNETILGDISALESDLHLHPDKWEHLRKMAFHCDDHPWPSIKHDFIVYTLTTFANNWLLLAFLDREPLILRLKDHRGSNPLVHAAYFHAIDQAGALLSRGANLHTHGWLIDDSRQVLPLVVAARGKGESDKMLRLFLQWQSVIPSDLFTDLTSQPSSFALPIIRRLLQTGAFVEWLRCHGGPRRLLHSFIIGVHFVTDDSEEDLVAIVWRLIQVGFDPRAANSSGETALHLALARGYLSLVEYLVSTGVPLPDNILPFMLGRDPDSRTWRMIRHLLEKGADVNRPVNDIDDNALHALIKTATSRSHAHILSSKDSDMGHESLAEMVKTLVGFGCDVHLRNAENYTPLHLAIIGGHVPVVKYLFQETTLPPDDLSDAISQAPSSVQDEIKQFLKNSHDSSAEASGLLDT